DAINAVLAAGRRLTRQRRVAIGHRVSNTNNIRRLGPSSIAGSPLVMAACVTLTPVIEKFISDEGRIEIVDRIEHDSRQELCSQYRPRRMIPIECPVGGPHGSICRVLSQKNQLLARCELSGGCPFGPNRER